MVTFGEGGCFGTACTDPISDERFSHAAMSKKNKATPLKEFLPCVQIVPWERLSGCAGGHRDRGSGPVGLVGRSGRFLGKGQFFVVLGLPGADHRVSEAAMLNCLYSPA